jgi:Spy/CpxP family protein refolding chaperone
MKTSRLVLVAIGFASMALSLSSLRADDASTNSLAASAPTGDKAQRMEKMKAALAQLDLTEAQKAQIKQLFDTMPAGKERRQAIVAVLTPDQKAKLKSMFAERRSEMQDGGAATPGAN